MTSSMDPRDDFPRALPDDDDNNNYVDEPLHPSAARLELSGRERDHNERDRVRNRDRDHDHDSHEEPADQHDRSHSHDRARRQSHTAYEDNEDHPRQGKAHDPAATADREEEEEEEDIDQPNKDAPRRYPTELGSNRHSRDGRSHPDDDLMDPRRPSDPDPGSGRRHSGGGRANGGGEDEQEVVGGSEGGGGGGSHPAASRGPPDISETVSLLVLNLSFRTTPGNLRSLFSRYGRLADVYIPKNRETGDSRGFAFIRYYLTEDAERAIEGMHNKSIDNREVQVQFARYGRQPVGQADSKGRDAHDGQRRGGYANKHGGASGRHDHRYRSNDPPSGRYGGGEDRYGGGGGDRHSSGGGRDRYAGSGGSRYGGGGGDRYGPGSSKEGGGDRRYDRQDYDRDHGSAGTSGGRYDRYEGGGRGFQEGYRGRNDGDRKDSRSGRSYGGRDSGSYGGGDFNRGGSEYDREGNNHGRGYGRGNSSNGAEDLGNRDLAGGPHATNGVASDGITLGRHPRSSSPRRGRSAGGSRSPSPKRYRGTPPNNRSPDAYDAPARG